MNGKQEEWTTNRQSSSIGISRLVSWCASVPCVCVVILLCCRLAIHRRLFIYKHVSQLCGSSVHIALMVVMIQVAADDHEHLLPIKYESSRLPQHHLVLLQQQRLCKYTLIVFAYAPCFKSKTVVI